MVTVRNQHGFLFFSFFFFSYFSHILRSYYSHNECIAKSNLSSVTVASCHVKSVTRLASKNTTLVTASKVYGFGWLWMSVYSYVCPSTPVRINYLGHFMESYMDTNLEKSLCHRDLAHFLSKLR